MSRASTLLTCCTLAVHAIAQSGWSVEALNIKPPGDDFAPVLSGGKLVFASIRDRAQAVAYTDARTKKPLADLYEVQLREGKPGHPRLLDGNLSTPLNDGPACFSPGGDTICITRNVAGAAGGKRRGELLGLFFSVKEKGAWSETRPFPFNSGEWSVMHACFSADGQTLLFTSDQPGGHGGTDLYQSRRSGTTWGEPVNLGAEVNSASNELFPSLDAAGVLRFSSDRAGGAGKLDLYASTPAETGWNAPAALPAPINSACNDIGWASNAERTSGYFSSDRDGTGQLYSFTLKAVPFRDCVEQKALEYCYAFEDAGSFNMDTLPLRYEWDFGDGVRQAGLSAQHCYKAAGTYAVKLNIVDTLSQSVYFNETGYDLEVVADEQAVIDGPTRMVPGVVAAFDMTASNLPGFRPQETHWDMGDSTVSTGPAIAHSYAVEGTYRVKMDLIGGPDGQGGFHHHCVYRDVQVGQEAIASAPEQPAYRSLKPDEAKYRFLYKELPSDPLQADAQNATDLPFSVQLFTSATRVSLADARFIPIRKHYPVEESFLPKERLYSYSIGRAKTPAALYDVFTFAQKAGFAESMVKYTPGSKPLEAGQVGTLALDALDNSVIRVSSVRFKTGERTYDPSFKEALDQVLQVVRKYPQVELVIEAHTDNVGKEADNMALSNDRAQGILDYFVANGIGAERLRPIGYGEYKPMADNGTEAGRAANRRVDFRLNVAAAAQIAHP